MKFMLVLVLGSVAAAESVEFKRNSLAVASVREHPSNLHKCTASFVTTKALITIASCVLSTSCKYKVAVYDSPDSEDCTLHKVRQIVLYPDFLLETENNIAVIKLERSVWKQKYNPLPPPDMEIEGLEGQVYSWLINDYGKPYKLQSNNIIVTTDEVCYEYTDESDSEKYFCVQADGPLHFRSGDRGSPTVVNEEGKHHIVGIFISSNTVSGEEVVKYLSVFPYLPWLRKVIHHF